MNKNTDALIEVIFKERPAFHRGETEVGRKFATAESLLPSEAAQLLAAGQAECYGIDTEVARFIASHVDASSHSLETGAGLSTLVFALQGSRHVSVTPNGQETEAIRQYAATKGIPTDSVSFVIEPSDQYLPTAKVPPLDFVFIDGKHAFPWPVLDWYYTVDRMKQNGIILVDDAHMISGKMLVDFMTVDPRWQRLADFNQKTFAFKKITPLVHDVAWHMQPYVVNALKAPSPGPVRRVVRKVKSLFR
jgi:predicted O-methyltransferase YrrM